MKKWGLMALSFCLLGSVGGNVWAVSCCKLSTGDCSSAPSSDCKKPDKFLERSECCDGSACSKTGFDCQGKPLLATLSNFTIVPFSGGFDLKWKTSSELDNAGFFIWRGIKEGDEYKNVHQVGELIPAQGKLIGGATYSYKDTISDFQKGTVYCYGLEDVDTRGITSFHYDFIRCFPK